MRPGKRNSLPINELERTLLALAPQEKHHYFLLLSSLKNVTSTFPLTAAIVTVVVGVLALGAWFARIAVITYMSNPHTYGDVEVTPYGYELGGPLTHSWDSVVVKQGENSYTVRNFKMDVTLLGDNKGANIALAEFEAQIKTDPSAKDEKKPKTPMEAIEFPEKAKFYIPAEVSVDKISVDVDKDSPQQMHWQAKDFSVKSNGLQKASIKLDSIQGDYISETTSIDLHADFESDKLKVKGKVKAGKDEVKLDVSSPKNNLAAVKTSVDMEVKDPSKWIPVKIPPAVPTIGAVKVKGDVRLDPKTQKPHYDLNLETRIGEFWPVMACNAKIKVKGDDENYHIETDLYNDEGGHIRLEGDGDKNLNGSLTGQVEYMSSIFGPHMMPLDMKIHTAHKEGDIIKVGIETRQGSDIDATIDLRKDVNITFTGDISPYEPWALDWNFGNLTLRNRFNLVGSFRNGVLHAKAKIPNIEFAYQMKADSLEVELDLNRNGIQFTNGIIYGEKETFDFFGDVMWEHEEPHTSWDVTQRHGGHAFAYITWTDSTTIQVMADSVDVSTIPFAKIKIGKEMNGEVTGTWRHNFTDNVGNIDLFAEGNYDPFDIKARIKARQNGDSIFIDKFQAMQNTNKVEAEAVFILPNDSNPDFKPTGFLPIQVVHAWASAKDFSIPSLLEPLNDTTLSEGFMNGDVSYEEGKGLLGNIDFTQLSLSKIPTSALKVDKMNLFAEGDRMELNAYVNIGNGGWAGSSQVIINNIFEDKRHVSVVHSTDNGGDLSVEGDLDSSYTFNGQVKVSGSWFIPGTTAEVTKTDLQIDVSAKIKEGLKGITAEIKSDSTFIQPPKMSRKIPFRIAGHINDGYAEITDLSTSNAQGETVSASAAYDLDSMRLDRFNIFSEQFSLKSGPHSVVVKEVSGSLSDYENELVVSVSLPYIQYNFFDETFGEGEAIAQSDLDFTIPRSTGDRLQNNSISGKLIVDKLIYHKALEFQITPTSLNRIFTMFNNFITKLRTTEVQETKISTASPINLMVHVNDSQRDSIAVVTPFATFPFTFDFWVLGNTNRPLLRGDVTNSNTGFIGVQELYEFELNSFSISWMDVPWQHGVVEVSSMQELPYCDDTGDKEGETCPINFDITGTITNPQPTPSSNCGTESSAAATYYNIILGCIADNNDESTDWNKIAGKAIGKVLSTTANKALGSEYIGDIDMKVMLFSNNTTSDKDSSYFKIPISLDRWVKDLSLIFGYTQDQSENPTYDQALQFGVNYTLPVFKGKEFSHKNHINPSLYLNGLLISKQYLTNTGAGGNESRLEKNVGFNYGYKFWNACLLGVGNCETISPNETLKESTEEQQETDK